jgi:hypothetical protein
MRNKEKKSGPLLEVLLVEGDLLLHQEIFIATFFVHPIERKALSGDLKTFKAMVIRRR